jgi:CheY-like chemotaxis protein
MLVTPNRFEGKLIADLLRAAGAAPARIETDSEAALTSLGCLQPNILVTALDAAPVEGLAWVRALRRTKDPRTRTAVVFILARALTASVAEACRVAGANAVIGLPVSGATLINTVKKVLAKPRPFIEAAGYIGPCRRAGIVTAGAGSRRRRSDQTSSAA